jgi:CheY-like chemotaxis protein
MVESLRLAERPRKLILLAIPRAEAQHKLEPLLWRTSMEIEQVASGDEALVLASRRRFDLIIAGIPLTDASMTRLITDLRRSGSPNSDTPLLVLATGSQFEAAKAYDSRQVRVFGLEESPEKLRCLLAESLGVAVRLSVRLPVEIQVELVGSREINRVCETRNISASGMLLRTDHLLSVGTGFDFNLTLPGTFTPFLGSARVVRHAEPSTEDILGMGTQFVHLLRGGRERLEHFVNSELGFADESRPQLTL